MATRKKPCKTCPGSQARKSSPQRRKKNVIKNATEVRYLLPLGKETLKVYGISGNVYTLSSGNETIIVDSVDAQAFDKMIRQSKKVWHVIGLVSTPSKKVDDEGEGESVSE